MKAKSHVRSRERERGVALALALFAMAALVVGATGSLLVGADDLQASRNYRGAQQAHFVAESGLTHALQNINAVGVVDFENEVVEEWDDNWIGSDAHDFGALPGYTYRVLPFADAANPSTLGWLRSTAAGPEGSANVVVARVQQSNIPGSAPGAIYLANTDPTNSTFQGDNFDVDGNDWNLDGSLNAAGEAQPGIATRNDANAQEAIDSLNASQASNVKGEGYVAGPPSTPSILTAPSGATVAQLNELIDTLLEQPGVNSYAEEQINNSNDDSFQSPSCGIGCCDPANPPSVPVISHFTAEELTIKGNGSVAGCGILIVEGDLTIQGTLDFLGLILVRGGTSIQPDSELGVTGNASVFGSLWTSSLNLVVGGSAIVRYSTEALAFADQVTPNGAFPAPLNVLALVNCAQVPAGTSGCP
jgi:hypothetical protein